MSVIITHTHSHRVINGWRYSNIMHGRCIYRRLQAPREFQVLVARVPAPNVVITELNAFDCVLCSCSCVMCALCILQ